RVFEKIRPPGARARAPAAGAPETAAGARMPAHRLHDLANEESPVARIVVDADGVLALANQRARTFFSLARTDRGRPLEDLEIAYRPLELRSLIEQAYAERRTIFHSG